MVDVVGVLECHQGRQDYNLQPLPVVNVEPFEGLGLDSKGGHVYPCTDSNYNREFGQTSSSIDPAVP
jgi:hypothetical protein